jgi:hypothetical protein
LYAVRGGDLARGFPNYFTHELFSGSDSPGKPPLLVDEQEARMNGTKNATRRLLRVPYARATAVGVLKRAALPLPEPGSDVATARQKALEDVRAAVAEERARATDRAVELGQKILRLRMINGPTGWDGVLREIGKGARSARNLMALALFAFQHPDLHGRFRTLGPTKLYRLATLNPEILRTLTLSTLVDTDRGRLALRDLTDRELIEFLRALLPPSERRRWRQVKQALLRARRRLVEAQEHEAPDPRDREPLHAAARELVARLHGILGGAAAGG